MTHRKFVLADPHWNHANMLKFVRNDGVTPVRNFKDLDEMHTCMKDNWNSTVRPQDKVYVAGDVAISKSGLAHLKDLNGRKCLIKGNHDIFKLKDYAEHFYDICSIKVLVGLGLVITHVPIHPDSFNRRAWRINVHGHLHTNIVMREVDTPDLRYYNISVEQINYTPKDLDEVYEETKNINREVDKSDKLM